PEGQSELISRAARGILHGHAADIERDHAVILEAVGHDERRRCRAGFAMSEGEREADPECDAQSSGRELRPWPHLPALASPRGGFGAAFFSAAWTLVASISSMPNSVRTAILTGSRTAEPPSGASVTSMSRFSAM